MLRLHSVPAQHDRGLILLAVLSNSGNRDDLGGDGMLNHRMRLWQFLLTGIIAALLISACVNEATDTPSPGANEPPSTATPEGNVENRGTTASPAANQQGPGQTTIPVQQPRGEGPAEYTPDVTFTLRTDRRGAFSLCRRWPEY
jgi:hypothetical protein